MSTEVITKEVISETGYETWFEFYGSLGDSTSHAGKRGEVYEYTNKDRQKTKIDLPLLREQLAELAFIELNELLKEARIKSVSELYGKIEGTRLDMEKNYKLEYSWLNPETKNPEYKIVTIPLSIIREFSKAENSDIGLYFIS